MIKIFTTIILILISIPFIKKIFNKSSNLKDDLSIYGFVSIIIFFIGLFIAIILKY